MIWPLQAIIGYGTKGTIYCPSLCSWLTPCPPLCCLYYRRTLLAPCLPPLPIPHFLLSFLLAFLWSGPMLLPSLYLQSEASGKQALSPPLSITFNHPDVYSALHPFHRPSTSLSPSFCATRLPLQAHYVSALNHSIAYHIPTSFHFYLSLSNCFLHHHLASAWRLCLLHFLSASKCFCPGRCCTICIVGGCSMYRWAFSPLKLYSTSIIHDVVKLEVHPFFQDCSCTVGGDYTRSLNVIRPPNPIGLLYTFLLFVQSIAYFLILSSSNILCVPTENMVQCWSQVQEPVSTAEQVRPSEPSLKEVKNKRPSSTTLKGFACYSMLSHQIGILSLIILTMQVGVGSGNKILCHVYCV